MTKVTLEIDGVKNTIEFEDDLTGPELLKGFCSLMHGQTYLIQTIKQSLQEVLDNYRQDATLILNAKDES